MYKVFCKNYWYIFFQLSFSGKFKLYESLKSTYSHGRVWSRNSVGMAADGHRGGERHATNGSRTPLHASADVR